MKFIKKVEKAEKSDNYRNFLVINTCEITKEEYLEYKDEF
jgi:hypothetical protein